MSLIRWIPALALSTALLGCGESKTLEGRWTGTDGGGNHMTFVFEDDGRAEWIMQPNIPGATIPPETIRMAYVADQSTDPATIDFSDFDFEPLQGTVTYGIYEFTDERSFRMDLEPAGPGQDESVRPATFSEETVTFTRAEGGE